MHIGEKTIKAVVMKLNQHLVDYRTEINEAYCGIEDGALSVNLSAKFSEAADGIKVDTSISFTKEKVKDGATFKINEDQLDIPFDGDVKISVVEGGE